MIRVGMPGRRMMRLPSASSSAWTGRPGARSPVAAGRAEAGSASRTGPGAPCGSGSVAGARRPRPGADRAGRGPAAGSSPRRRRASSSARRLRSSSFWRRSSSSRLRASAAARSRASRASRSARRFDLLLGVTAILLLADAGVGEGVRAGIALRIGQRAQHHAARARRGRRCGAAAAPGRPRRRRGARPRRARQRPRRHSARPSPAAGPTRRLTVSTTTALRAAVREALPNRVLLGRPLQRTASASTRCSVFSLGALGIRIAHSTHIPAGPPSASGVILRAVFGALTGLRQGARPRRLPRRDKSAADANARESRRRQGPQRRQHVSHLAAPMPNPIPLR